MIRGQIQYVFFRSPVISPVSLVVTLFLDDAAGVTPAVTIVDLGNDLWRVTIPAENTDATAIRVVVDEGATRHHDETLNLIDSTVLGNRFWELWASLHPLEC